MRRESLNRDFAVPVLSTVGVEYIETVTFSFVISTPLVLPNSRPINTIVLWSENGSSKVVGHLGHLVACNLCCLKRIELLLMDAPHEWPLIRGMPWGVNTNKPLNHISTEMRVLSLLNIMRRKLRYGIQLSWPHQSRQAAIFSNG